MAEHRSARFNLLQSDGRPTTSSSRSSTLRERRRSTANVHKDVAHHHDFGQPGLADLARALAHQPESRSTRLLKVAADFLTMNYHDGYGIPGGRDAPCSTTTGRRQKPALRDGDDHLPGNCRARRSSSARSSRCATFCFCTDGVSRPPHRSREGNPRRSVRVRPGVRTSRCVTGGEPDSEDGGRGRLLGR